MQSSGGIQTGLSAVPIEKTLLDGDDLFSQMAENLPQLSTQRSGFLRVIPCSSGCSVS